MTAFCHTGALEVFHSLLTKYVPKRKHFSFEGMEARTLLAALDHNINIDREQATTTEGKLRYKVVFPKGQKNWVAKPIKEEKNYAYRLNMIDNVLQAKREGAPVVIPTRCQRQNIASVPRPPKEEVIQKHMCRFTVPESV